MTAPAGVADTIVVIPCHDEARRLRPDLLDSFVQRARGVRLVCVDDGSTDDTRVRLAALAAGRPEIGVIGLPANVGKAEAVRAGIVAALREAPEFVGYWDADLSTPLSQIEVFRAILRTREDFDAVIGSRIRRLGADVRRNARRHYLGRVFATCASFVLGLPVYDTQCGAKLFRVTERLRHAFSTPFVASWAFDVELIARLRATDGADLEHQRPAAIVEYPLDEWRDVPGSKLKLAGMAGALVDLWRIWRVQAGDRGLARAPATRTK